MKSLQVLSTVLITSIISLSILGCHVDTDEKGFSEDDQEQLQILTAMIAASQTTDSDESDTEATTADSAELKNILVQDARISPEFKSYITSYSVTLDCDSTLMEMTVVPVSYDNDIFVNDTPVEGGVVYSYRISQSSQAFTIVSRTSDSTKEKTYVLNVATPACDTTSTSTSTSTATSTSTSTDV